MITACKDWAKRHWPALHLRTILLMTLVFAAALPVIGAVALRSYETLLVRQTEASLVGQGAAIAAVAASLWPGHGPDRDVIVPPPLPVDLGRAALLPDRPPPQATRLSADPAALRVGATLLPALTMTSRTSHAAIVLVDRQGVIVAGVARGQRLTGLTELDAAFAGRATTALRWNSDYQALYDLEWLSRAAALRLHHARPIRVDGHIVGAVLLSQSPRALFRNLYRDRGQILVAAAAIATALLMLAGLLSRGIARPIDALAAATRAVALGGTDVPMPPATAAIEIRDLYRHFAAMAEALARRSAYLRHFAAAVSHEFKTPLSAIRGSVELLREEGDAMAPADRVRFLAAIAIASERLTLLVSRMLELARADMPEAGAERADLTAVLHRIVDAHSDMSMVITVTGADRPLWVKGAPASLESVLTILTENARQAGATLVHFAVATAPGQVRLTCADDGPGIPPGDRGRVFEPFFTSRRGEGGTGLGLPIARALLASVGGEIALAEAATGSRFILSLPLAGA